MPSSDCIFKLNLNTWLNDYIKCLRDQKNEIFKRYVKDEAPNTVYQNLQVIASDLTKAISGSKNVYYERLLNKLNDPTTSSKHTVQ